MSNPFEQLTKEEVEQFYINQSVHLDQSPIRSPLFYPFSRTLDEKSCSFNPLFCPKLEVGESSSSSSNSSEIIPLAMAIQPQRSLKELATHNLNNQPLCINVENANFELKSGFIHLLPCFNGLVGEDPHSHLKEFHMVYNRMKPQGV